MEEDLEGSAVAAEEQMGGHVKVFGRHRTRRHCDVNQGSVSYVGFAVALQVHAHGVMIRTCPDGQSVGRHVGICSSNPCAERHNLAVGKRLDVCVVRCAPIEILICLVLIVGTIGGK